MTSPSERIKDLRAIENEARSVLQGGYVMAEDIQKRYKNALHTARIERLELQLMLSKQGYRVSIDTPPKEEPKKPDKQKETKK